MSRGVHAVTVNPAVWYSILRYPPGEASTDPQAIGAQAERWSTSSPDHDPVRRRARPSAGVLFQQSVQRRLDPHSHRRRGARRPRHDEVRRRPPRLVAGISDGDLRAREALPVAEAHLRDGGAPAPGTLLARDRLGEARAPLQPGWRKPAPTKYPSSARATASTWRPAVGTKGTSRRPREPPAAAESGSPWYSESLTGFTNPDMYMGAQK